MATAHDLFPGRKPETKNRSVIKPAAAILHYAARNKWCEWLRIERFAEAAPVTRAATADQARLLLAALAKEIRTTKTPHRKHRFFSLKRFKPWEVNLRDLTVYKEGETVSPATLIEKGVVSAGADRVKILGTGELNRRLTFTDVAISAPARVKIERAGGTITP